jgi:SAM-dependent methyltransferase
MSSEDTHIDLNKKYWNLRTDIHYKSEFYDNKNFINGRNSLMNIERDLLGDITGKSILHLQCHFGQDTISLTRSGAQATGIDLSDQAISRAKKLAKETNSNTKFICCNLYDSPNFINEKFDIVFTSYGTISWLPDLHKWAKVISHFLKPEGRFIMAEFHPVVWMFDDLFEKIEYSYFNRGPIVEEIKGSYAEKDADISGVCVLWDHSISDIVNNLINAGLTINSFNEYDYSPYDCFQQTVKISADKFRIKHLDDKIPLTFSIDAQKTKGRSEHP